MNVLRNLELPNHLLSIQNILDPGEQTILLRKLNVHEQQKMTKDS